MSASGDTLTDTVPTRTRQCADCRYTSPLWDWVTLQSTMRPPYARCDLGACQLVSATAYAVCHVLYDSDVTPHVPFYLTRHHNTQTEREAETHVLTHRAREGARAHDDGPLVHVGQPSHAIQHLWPAVKQCRQSVRTTMTRSHSMPSSPRARQLGGARAIGSPR